LWATGCVKPKEHLITPNLQDSINTDAQWNAEEKKAICGCLRLLVGAWQVMYARASASQFLPHNSSASQSMVVVSMQMDAYLKKEQIGTLFVWVGPREGGFRGGEGKGDQPKYGPPVHYFFF